MSLENKVNSGLLSRIGNKIKSSLTSKILAYSLASSLGLGGIYSLKGCGYLSEQNTVNKYACSSRGLCVSDSNGSYTTSDCNNACVPPFIINMNQGEIKDSEDYHPVGSSASLTLTPTHLEKSYVCVAFSPNPASLHTYQGFLFHNNTSNSYTIFGCGNNTPWTSVGPGEDSGRLQFEESGTTNYGISPSCNTCEVCGSGCSSRFLTQSYSTIYVTIN